jgi:hypothetical protein
MKLRGFTNEEDLGRLEVWRYMPLARFLCLLEFEAMWFSRLGALQDEFECTNPKGPRAFLLRMANNPKFKDAQTPMGGTFHDLLQMTDNGRSGDTGRQMGLAFSSRRDNRKLASHIVAGLAPANHRVLNGRWKIFG